MIPLEIFFVGIVIVTIAARIIGFRVQQKAPPAPPNKVQWDLEKEG